MEESPPLFYYTLIRKDGSSATLVSTDDNELRVSRMDEISKGNNAMKVSKTNKRILTIERDKK